MATNPTLLTMPIAENGTKNTIPTTTTTLGRMSQDQGFPAETSLPLAAGGVAPNRADFNGAFNLLSDINFYAQKGWQFLFDASQDYYAGCIVRDATDGQLYECIDDVSAGGSVPSADTTHWRVSEKVFYFDSVADMRDSAAVAPGMMVMTKGYYSPNDGGAATYNIRAAQAGDIVDEQSIILLDNGNVAERVTFQTDVDYSNEGIFRFGVMDTTAYCNGLATDGINFYVGFYKSGGNSYIVKYDGKGVELAIYTADSDYHYNSLAWDNKNSCLYALKDGTTLQKFSSSLSLIETITLPGWIYSISVDVLSGNICGFSDGYIYQYADDFSVDKSISVPSFPTQINTSQNAAVYGNRVFFVRNYPNTIFEYDMLTNTILNVTKFADSIDNTFLGEIQGITVVPIGNRARINVSFALYIAKGYYNTIFELTELDDIVSFTPAISINNGNPVQRVNIYVDAQSASTYANGTADAPFRSLMEALAHTAKPLNYYITVDNANSIIDAPSTDTYVTTGKYTFVFNGDVPNDHVRFYNSFITVDWRSSKTYELDVENCVVNVFTDNNDGDASKLQISARSSDITVIGDIRQIFNVNSTVRVTGKITSITGSGYLHTFDSTNNPTHTLTVNAQGAGVVRISAANAYIPLAAIVSITSNDGVSDNQVYLVTGYGAGGSGRTKVIALTAGSTVITPAVDASANAVDFTCTSDNSRVVYATILGGNIRYINLTFTAST